MSQTLEQTVNWEPYKAVILSQYVDQNHTLENTMNFMLQTYGLKATIKQYKNRFSGYKNLKKHEWIAVLHELQNRARQGLKSEVLLHGRPLGGDKINRGRKRYGAENQTSESRRVVLGHSPADRIFIRTPICKSRVSSPLAIDEPITIGDITNFDTELLGLPLSQDLDALIPTDMTQISFLEYPLVGNVEGTETVLQSLGRSPFPVQAYVAQNETPLGRPMNTPLAERYMWFTGPCGNNFHLLVENCVTVRSFVLSLMFTLRASGSHWQDSMEDKFMRGEFWFVDDENSSSDLSSPHLIGESRVILADVWDNNVRPGRRLRMVVFDGDVRITRDELALIHETWKTHVKPSMGAKSLVGV